MKVLGYGRISDASDNDETSLENQESEIQEEADETGMTLVKWYQDKNVSGSTDPFDRDEFSQLVEHLQETPAIKMVMIRRGDRLWRDGKTEEVVQRLKYEYDVEVDFYEVDPSALTQLKEEIEGFSAIRELIGDLEVFVERMEIERARMKAENLIKRKRANGEPFHRPPRGITTDKQKNGNTTATEWVPVDEYYDDDDNRVRYNEFDVCIEMLNKMAETGLSPYQVGKKYGVPHPDRKLKNLWKRRKMYRVMAKGHRRNVDIHF